MITVHLKGKKILETNSIDKARELAKNLRSVLEDKTFYIMVTHHRFNITTHY